MSSSRPQARSFLIVTAVIELATGFVLVAFPSLLATLLLGASVEGPVAMTLTRVAGVALLSLGVACWLARDDGSSRAARGLLGAMVLYNVGVATVLAYCGVALGLSGLGLWPVVLLHVGMSVWSVMCVRGRAVVSGG
jgi:hypothetical protein